MEGLKYGEDQSKIEIDEIKFAAEMDNFGLDYHIGEKFKLDGFILNGHWTGDKNYQAKVFKIDNDKVYCDCLVDKENLKFEKRAFPRQLFSSIDLNKPELYIYIGVKMKPGEMKIEILEGGKDLVNKSLFSLKDRMSKIDPKIFRPISTD